MRGMLILIGLLTTSAQAQLDSLLRVLDELPRDTTRLPVLTEILRGTVFTDPEEALRHAAEYLAIAEAAGDSMELGKGHNYSGMCWSVKARPEEALRHYLAALAFFERGDDPWYTAMAHNNVASIYKDERRPEDALAQFTLALKGFSGLGDTVWMANVSNNLANLHYDQGRLDSAIHHYQLADRILTGRGQDAFAAQVRMNLGNALYRAGDLKGGLSKVREALIQHPMGTDEAHRANILIALGHLEGLNQERDSALFHLRMGMRLALEAGAAIALADGEEFLADLYEHWGMADSALVHFKRMKVLRDSLLNSERSAQIADLQVRYETGLKDAELTESRAALERRTLIIKAVATGAGLLLIAVLFAFRAYRIKRKGEAELARKNAIIEGQLKEKELLLREIHHRVKNNLQTVSSLLSIQGRGITDEAAKQAVNDSRLRVKSMALIHQDLYREGDLTGVQMQEYVQKLANGLVTSHGMADHVQLDLRVQPIYLDVDTAVPIGLILNELVTNALKYAWPKGQAGKLVIELKDHKSELVILIADDGIGIQDVATASAGGTGFGLGMIRTFASKLKAEHSISCEGGTTVRLSVRNYKRTA